MTVADSVTWPGAPALDPAAARQYLEDARAQLGSGDRLEVQTAAVVGGSQQGLGFAMALARVGVCVSLIEDDAHDARRVRDVLTRADALARITISCDLSAVQGVGLVIEAGLPGAARLRQLRALSAFAASGALLVCCGGGLLQKAEMGRFVAIDTAAPPPDFAVLEILARPETSERDLGRTEGLARLLGGLGLRTPEFISSRLLAQLEDVVEALVFRGSTPWEIDGALEAFGFGLGPCAAQDLRGLDQAVARHRAEGAAGARRVKSPVLARMVAEGRLGRRGGVGWYRYPGGGGRVVDPLIEDLVREEAYFAGVPRRPICDDDLRQHCILALMRAASDLIARGVPAPLVDLVACAATGFPTARGGPGFFARQIGVERVAAQWNAVAGGALGAVG